MQLSVDKIENLLVDLHFVDSDRIPALRSRMRKLSREGLTPKASSGRGKPAYYGIGDLMLIICAFELLEIGMTPKKSVALALRLERSLVEVAHQVGPKIAQNSWDTNPETHIFLSFDPNEIDGSIDIMQRVTTSSGVFKDTVNLYDDEGFWFRTRRVIINMSAILFRASLKIDVIGGVHPIDEFAAALIAWNGTYLVPDL